MKLRRFLLERKAMTNLDSILQSRDITLLTKVLIVKAMVFPIAIHSASWARKKAEHQRIDAFKLWCWRTLLRAPWPAKRSNQSILRSVLNIHCKDWCWSSDTLATWCGQPTHWKESWCWERLKAGEAGDGGWDGWMAPSTQWTLSLHKPQGIVKDREAWHAVAHEVTKSQTRLSDWTATTDHVHRLEGSMFKKCKFFNNSPTDSMQFPSKFKGVPWQSNG